MKIDGKEVPQACIDAVIARMKQGTFRARDLRDICLPFGVCGVRGPDRLIRQQREKQNIELAGKACVWRWRGGV